MNDVNWGQSDFCSVNFKHIQYCGILMLKWSVDFVSFETKTKMTYTCQIFVFVA